MILYDTLISKRQTRIKEDERIYCTVEMKIFSYIKMVIASYNFLSHIRSQHKAVTTVDIYG